MTLRMASTVSMPNAVTMPSTVTMPARRMARLPRHASERHRQQAHDTQPETERVEVHSQRPTLSEERKHG
jgi:hypothetical protein